MSFVPHRVLYARGPIQAVVRGAVHHARRSLVAGGCALALLGPGLSAAGEVWRVPTREGVHTTVWWAAATEDRGAAQAPATVLLFPGGEGGFGKVEGGWPQSENFLVRSAAEFVRQGLNVAIVGRANGRPLQPAERMGSEHMQDIRQVVQAVRAHSSAPLWLVGTSRGTTSVAAAAIALQDLGLAGVVLTSSIVAPQEPGAVPSMALEAVHVPVLLIQNGKDECHLCSPAAMPALLERFSQAPIKQLRVVDGGGPPSGGTCHAHHWHGFIGMEPAVVAQIAQWIRQPQP